MIKKFILLGCLIVLLGGCAHSHRSMPPSESELSAWPTKSQLEEFTVIALEAFHPNTILRLPDGRITTVLGEPDLEKPIRYRTGDPNRLLIYVPTTSSYAEFEFDLISDSIVSVRNGPITICRLGAEPIGEQGEVVNSE